MITQVEMHGLNNVAMALAEALVSTKRYQLRELGASAVVGGQQFRVIVWDRSSDGSLTVQAHSEDEDTAGQVVYSGSLAEMAGTNA